MRAPPMARLHQQLRVRAHERHRHRDLGPIGQHRLRPQAELLDCREDVVPPSRVEPGGVVTQLVKDLVHLERGQNRLDEHCGADRSAWDA
jgi:hypothetical protein